ncbi:MAG: hypothetical protein ACE5L6_04990 [Candidatus Bathyarchaeia archaeon]
MKEGDVVVGAILDGEKFLVERRRSNEEIDPSIVCLPGFRLGRIRAERSIEKRNERRTGRRS